MAVLGITRVIHLYFISVVNFLFVFSSPLHEEDHQTFPDESMSLSFIRRDSRQFFPFGVCVHVYIYQRRMQHRRAPLFEFFFGGEGGCICKFSLYNTHML